MSHAQKPPPGDGELILVMAILAGTLGSLYIFLHNWIALLVSMFQCGPEC